MGESPCRLSQVDLNGMDFISENCRIIYDNTLWNVGGLYFNGKFNYLCKMYYMFLFLEDCNAFSG